MTTTLTPPLTATLAGLPTIPAGYGRMLNPASDEARVLERTADLLITDGWCQGASTDSNGRRCLTFAVAVAVSQLFGHYSPATMMDIWVETCGILADTIRLREGDTAPWVEAWNDRDGRSLDDVLDLVAAARVAAS